jgi:predicted RNase H-like nuclease
VLVLGVDAAWTCKNPSGIALVKWSKREKHQLVALARSYDEFLVLDGSSRIDWLEKVSGSRPDMSKILNHACSIGGNKVSVIALDIPLSPKPITGRRVADNKISSKYGGLGAGTHTPSAERPSELSGYLFESLVSLDFTWAGKDGDKYIGEGGIFLETYPHPAIIEMLNLSYRLPYKASKVRKYWPELPSSERWVLLINHMETLRDGLASNIKGLSGILPDVESLNQYPRWVLTDYENVLDALVCAWVGCQYLAGNATVHGDSESAIWLPSPSSNS